MLAYDWPGNVRELENCLERTYAFTSGPLIHTTDLPREIGKTASDRGVDRERKRQRTLEDHSHG